MSSFFKVLIFSCVASLVSCKGGAPVTNLQYDKVLGEAQQHNSRTPVPTLATHLAFDRAHNRIITLQQNGDLLLWSEDGRFSETLSKDVSGFSYCAVSGAIIHTGVHGVHLLSIGQRTKRNLRPKKYDYVAISDDCGRIALAREDEREIEVLSIDQPESPKKIKTSAPVRNGLTMSRDGAMLSAALGSYDASIGHNTMIEVFDLGDDLEVQSAQKIEMSNEILGMWTMSFSPIGDRLFVPTQVNNKSGIKAFASASGTTQWAQNGFSSYWVRALAVSPNGTVIATGDEKGFLRIWDAQSGTLLAERQVGLVIQSLAFSSDGHELAIGLWNAQIGVVVMDKLFSWSSNI